MRTFCSSEDTVKSEKAMHEWEKIFAIHLPNKGLVSIVYKRVLPVNKKNTGNQ